MSQIQPQINEDTCLRRCSECHFAVNNTEWKLCRRHECPIHFPALALEHGAQTLVCNSISLEEKRAFIAAQGMHCPFCGTQALQPTNEPDPVANNKLTRAMICENHHTWHELFTLTGVLTDDQHNSLYPCQP